MSISLKKHQLRAIELLESGSVLTGAPGSGKSRTALVYFFTKECRGGLKINGKGELAPMARPMDLYIITTARKRNSFDWQDEAGAMRIFENPDDSFCNVKLTVDSWNNIGKYKEVEGAFFIFDEQRLVGSGEWVKSFLKIAKANRWILLSGTPGDTWMDYIPVFIANGYYKNRTEFTDTHVIYQRFAKYPKVDRYIATGRLERQRREITVSMPMVRHTTRHQVQVPVTFDKEGYDRITRERWHIYEQRPIRDISELIATARRFVNSDPSRIEAIRKLAADNPRLIVFYNFDYELEILRELSDEHVVAEWNGHKHEPLPEGDRWIYLVQYTAGAEAWNCITTDSIVFYSLNYSYRIMEQARGRIDRMNTPYVNLYYYTIRSMSSVDSSILKALREKRDFNIKDFPS